MSIWHKLFRFLLPGKIGDMEAESRKWMVQCPCGGEKSLWEIGGIRYGSQSRNTKTLRRCEQCGKLRVNRIYKKTDEQQQGSGS